MGSDSRFDSARMQLASFFRQAPMILCDLVDDSGSGYTVLSSKVANWIGASIDSTVTGTRMRIQPFLMFYFRYKPLIAVAMIASLIVAQFSHVPHVHAGSSSEDKIEHDGRAHVHIGHRDKGSHGQARTNGHSHNNGHSHGHSQQDKAKCKPKPQSSTVAFNVDHDQDAVYLSLSPVSFSIRTALQVDQIQMVDCHLYDYPFSGIPNQAFDTCDLWHPPDKRRDCKGRHCPIYLLNRSIRC